MTSRYLKLRNENFGEFRGRTPNSEVQEFGVRPRNSLVINQFSFLNFRYLLLFLVGSAGRVVGSEEKRLAVWKRQIASVCTQRSVLGLISVDENLGSRFQ